MLPQIDPFKVTVVIPAHNPGRFLRQALESVFAQTYRNFTVHVVDDGSSEDLSWVPTEFPEVEYTKINKVGVAVARNVGILAAKTDLIALLDADDIWRPTKLQKQVAAFQAKPELGLCYTRLYLIDADNQVIKHPQYRDDVGLDKPEYEITFDPTSNVHGSVLLEALRLIKRDVPSGSTPMFRKSALAYSGILDPWLPFTAEFDMLSKVIARFPAAVIPTAEVAYRRHENNWSNSFWISQSEGKEMARRYSYLASVTNDRQLSHSVRRIFVLPGSAYAPQAFDLFRIAFRNRALLRAGNLLLQALLFDPVFVLKSIVYGIGIRLHKKSATSPRNE